MTKNWHRRILNWLNKKAHGSWRCEINVARNGIHVLATDSHIRQPTKEMIAAQILEIRNAFPGCVVSVTCWNGGVPDVVQAALDGSIDTKRLDKAISKQLQLVQSIRDEGVGGAETDHTPLT